MYLQLQQADELFQAARTFIVGSIVPWESSSKCPIRQSLRIKVDMEIGIRLHLCRYF